MCSQKVGSTPGIEYSHNKSSSFAHLDPETGCKRPCTLRHKCGKKKIKPPSQMKIWKLCCTTSDSDLLLSPLPRNSRHILFRNPWPCYWNTCTFQIVSESAHILFQDLGSINRMILWGIIWGLRFLWLLTYFTTAQQQMLLVGTCCMYCREEFSLKQIDFAVKDVGKLICGRTGKVPMSPPHLPQNPSMSQLLWVDTNNWLSGVQGQLVAFLSKECVWLYRL